MTEAIKNNPAKPEKVHFPELCRIHIIGIIMTVFLLLMGSSAIWMLLWSGADMYLTSVGDGAVSALEEVFGDILPMNSSGSAGINITATVSRLSTTSTITTIVWLIATVILLVLINRQSVKVAERYHTFATDQHYSGQTVRVKKTAYILLGFLLGSFGAHCFLVKREGKVSIRAILMLAAGILGLSFMPFMIYTTGVSFADAWVACRLKKDEAGYIEVVDYNRIF